LPAGGLIRATAAPLADLRIDIPRYRIYRDGKPYKSRYDTSDTTPPLEYTDINHSGSHTYYMTAVGSTLVESEFAGPVTG